MTFLNNVLAEFFIKKIIVWLSQLITVWY